MAASPRRKDQVGGGKRGPGRPKGSPNKITRDMREMMWKAFDQKGGVDYLVKHADENPKAFMALLSKLLPNEVVADVKTENTVRIVDLSSK